MSFKMTTQIIDIDQLEEKYMVKSLVAFAYW